jgi:hypothetical protein
VIRALPIGKPLEGELGWPVVVASRVLARAVTGTRTHQDNPGSFDDVCVTLVGRSLRAITRASTIGGPTGLARRSSRPLKDRTRRGVRMRSGTGGHAGRG